MAKSKKKTEPLAEKRARKLDAAHSYLMVARIKSRMAPEELVDLRRAQRGALFDGMTPSALRKAYGKRILLKDVPVTVSGNMPQRYRKHFDVKKGDIDVERKVDLHAAPLEHGARTRKIINPLRRILKMPEIEPRVTYHFHLKKAPLLDRYWSSGRNVDGKAHTEFVHEHEPSVHFVVRGKVAQIVEKYREDKL